MKKMSFVFLAIFFLSLSLSCREKLFGELVIKNVNIVDVDTGEILSDQDVVINADTIAAVQPSLSNTVYVGEKIIDGIDKYLIPGLFDCHVHTSSEPSYISKFIHFGVTSVFITGGGRATNEFYEKMRNLGNQDSQPAPRVFHTGQHFTMEGRHPVKTYGPSNWVEGETVYFLRDTIQIELLVKEVAEQPIQGIKLTIEDGPNPPFVERMPQEFVDKVQKEAQKNGLEVFAHVSDNVELEMAVKAGIKNFVHFTGIDLDFKRDSTLVSKIYRDSIDWVTTFMLDKSFLYPLHPEWIEDSNIQGLYPSETFASLKDSSAIFRARQYVSFMKEYLNLDNLSLKDVVQFQVDDIKILMQNGVNMVLGTDTGNTLILPGYSLHEEMQLMELGGLHPSEILKMGTLNAAKMLKAQDSLGSIAVGKLADMVLLDKNPLEAIKNTLAIEKVIKNGKIQERIGP